MSALQRLITAPLCALAFAALAVLPTSARAEFGIAPGSFTASTNQAPPPGSPPGLLGPLDTQAADHPFSATTSFAFNGTSDPAVPDQNVKDITVDLPAGFVGDPLAVPQCPRADADVGACPIDSQVGVAALTLAGNPARFPVFDVVPSAGEPADFEFTAVNVPVHVATRIRTGGDYGVSTVAADVSERQSINAVSLTLWGVPGDPSHDPERGQVCTNNLCSGGGQPFIGVTVKPLLTNPSFCGPPLSTTISADSWQSPGSFVTATATTPTGPTGCGKLSFTPSIGVQPDSTVASSPTGLAVDLHVPWNDDPNGLAVPALRKAIVTLPAGMTVNPAAADGLAACSSAQIDLSGTAPANCPDASKIGSVEVDSPLIDHPLPGSVYLAAQSDNPFGSLLAIYIVVDDPQSGIVVKLAGHVAADPATGQLTSTFDNNPQLPFSDLKVDLFGGPRAALVTPATCGAFQTTSALTPWSAPASGPDATPSDVLTIDSGPTGAPCPPSLSGIAFSPGFAAGTLNPAAGAFSPLEVTLSRSDRDQDLAGVTLRMAPGLLGSVANVPLCGEPQAARGQCPPASQVGHVVVAAGAGPQPLYLPQAGKPQDPVYLTGPYKGAPFGLSVVVPAEAGPFKLGTVVVRAEISVDPHTAQIKVASDPLPSILQGIPLKLRKVTVSVDRPGFIFNPTNCSPLTVDGTITSTQAARAPVSSGFQAADCASLAFKPRFTVSTQAHTSKANGASLHVRVSASPGQANIGKVKVDLPKQLPSRLSTLQKACPDGTFNANPAVCPAGSLDGTATAVTPVLKSPPSGPVYLVSHAGAAFPDLVIVLQGEGITLELVGKTDIKKGITISTFDALPDAPISSFYLVLPEGPHSVLGAYLPAKSRGSLCGQELAMPTAITGQNGAVIRQRTRIAISGCSRRRARKAAHLRT
jgi:hypothetical protein